MLAEIHVAGLKRPFPRLYWLIVPEIGSTICWHFTTADGTRHTYHGTVESVSQDSTPGLITVNRVYHRPFK